MSTASGVESADKSGIPAQRRPLRADAERNRLRILAAARELFAERGLDVSLDDVADAAGVGIGTVYRRFANREELINGIFVEHLKTVADQVGEAIENPDPWGAVVELTTWMGTVMAQDRGLAAIIMTIDHSQPDIAARKLEMTAGLDKVFTQAMDAGVLRPGLSSSDFFGIFTMLSAVADISEPVVPGTWRRYLQILLDGIHIDGSARHELSVPPASNEQIREMQRVRLESRRAGSAG